MIVERGDRPGLLLKFYLESFRLEIEREDALALQIKGRGVMIYE
jgi:hypothetical protein